MKKLFVLLICFVSAAVVAQLPPMVRNPFSTNLIPINGVSISQTNRGHTHIDEFNWRTNTTDKTITLKSFGAVGDGHYINTCYATNGNRRITTANTYGEVFSASDIGKVFHIYFGGTNGQQNWTTIVTNFISSTQIEVSNAPVYSVTNWPCFIATDDTIAIQTAFNWVITNAGWTLVVENGAYCINGALQDTGNFTNHHNAQIYAPDVSYLTDGQKSRVVVIRGSTPIMGGDVTFEVSHLKVQGSMFVSTLAWAPTNDLLRSSVFEFKSSTPRARDLSPNFYPRYLVTFNYITPVFENIWFRASFNNSMTLLNLGGTPACKVKDCFFDAGFFQSAAPVLPTRANFLNTVGLALPQEYNDNRVLVDNCTISWFRSGLLAGENMRVIGCQFWDCFYGIDFINSGGNLMTLAGFNCFADCENVFAHPGMSIHIDDIANVQNGQVTTYNTVFDALPEIGTTNDNFSGTITVFYSNPAIGAKIGDLRKLKLIEINNSVTGPEVTGSNVFHGPMFVDGGLTLKSNIIRMGSDTTNSTLTAGSRKSIIWDFSQFSASNYDSTFFGVDSQFANQASMYLGGTPFAGHSHGPQQIWFNPSATVGQDYFWGWGIDETGALLPGNNKTGNYSDSHDVASDTYPAKTVYVTTLSATNLTYKGLTNVVGTTVKGQLKVTANNGAVYYIDLKQ